MSSASKNYVSSGQFRREITDAWLNQVAQDQGALSNRDIRLGRGLSSTDMLKMQYDINQANAERQWQEDMYNKYQSPKAMVDQYQQAGLNPALMYGSGASSGSSSLSGTTPPTSDGIGNNSGPLGIDIASQVMSMVTGTASVASEIGNKYGSIKQSLSQASLNRASERNTDADTLLKEQQRLNLITEREGKQIDNEYKRVEKQLAIESVRTSIDKSLQDIRESVSRISLNDSQIEVNGSVVALNFKLADKADSETALNAAKTTLTNLDAAKAQIMLPLVRDMALARLAVDNAQATELSASAERQYAEKALTLVNTAYQQGLLDKGQLDLVIQGMKEDNKNKKRMRSIATANCIIGNICNIVNSATGVAAAASGMGAAVPLVNGATGQSLVTSTGAPLVM